MLPIPSHKTALPDGGRKTLPEGITAVTSDSPVDKKSLKHLTGLKDDAGKKAVIIKNNPEAVAAVIKVSFLPHRKERKGNNYRKL